MTGREVGVVLDLVACLQDAHEFQLLEGHFEAPGLVGLHPETCIECAAIRDGLLMTGRGWVWEAYQSRFPGALVAKGPAVSEVLW